MTSSSQSLEVGLKQTFTPEFRDEAVKMVLTTERRLCDVARDLGMNSNTLGHWVADYRNEHLGEEAPVTASGASAERRRIVRLQRENQKLKEQNKFLRQAVVFFARDRW